MSSRFRTAAEVLETVGTVVEFSDTSPVKIDSVGIFGSQPLKTVVTWDDPTAVELLLAAGAHIDAQHEDGDTALHHAIRMGHFAIVRLLVARGANQQIRNDEGKLPRDYCWSEEWAALGLSNEP